jgi:hypothetical protein
MEKGRLLRRHCKLHVGLSASATLRDISHRNPSSYNIGAKLFPGAGITPFLPLHYSSSFTFSSSHFFFAQCPQAGKRFSAHVITSITARIKANLITESKLEELEIGAVFLDRQHTNGLHFHIQMSAFCINNIAKNLQRTLRYE